jgi:hypothetical protein
MDNSRHDASPTLDAFRGAILGERNPASAAAFAAAILREHGPEEPGDEKAGRSTGVSHEDWLDAILYGAPETFDPFAAEILREYNYKPDEPRDENGRWTTGGSRSSGTSGGSGVFYDDWLDAIKHGVPGSSPGTSGGCSSPASSPSSGALALAGGHSWTHRGPPFPTAPGAPPVVVYNAERVVPWNWLPYSGRDDYAKTYPNFYPDSWGTVHGVQNAQPVNTIPKSAPAAEKTRQAGMGKFYGPAAPGQDRLVGPAGCGPCVGVVIVTPDGQVAAFHFAAAGGNPAGTIERYAWPKGSTAAICGGNLNSSSKYVYSSAVGALQAAGVTIVGISRYDQLYWGQVGNKKGWFLPSQPASIDYGK